jgi:ubiquinone/menaquinone biosynthesis C-methylase UbiE
MHAHPHVAGIIFRRPRAYDWLLRLIWGKGERRYRQRVLDLAGVAPGKAVLDVGCGTGTLAIVARERVGPEGHVSAVDASFEMIAHARAKARAVGAAVDFREAPAQSLPFADARFDIVLSTTVIHCLPKPARLQCFREMARVLRPGGTLLIVDFGGSERSKHSLFGHMKAHRRFELGEEKRRVAAAGLDLIESDDLGFSDLHYLLARRASETTSSAAAA